MSPVNSQRETPQADTAYEKRGEDQQRAGYRPYAGAHAAVTVRADVVGGVVVDHRRLGKAVSDTSTGAGGVMSGSPQKNSHATARKIGKPMKKAITRFSTPARQHDVCPQYINELPAKSASQMREVAILLVPRNCAEVCA